jgi:PAS domain S-box-containing protein
LLLPFSLTGTAPFVWRCPGGEKAVEAPIAVMPKMPGTRRPRPHGRAFHRSEERLRFALETAQLGYWEIHVGTMALFSSRICKSHWGRAANDNFSLANLIAAIHDDDRVIYEYAVHRAVHDGADIDIDLRAIWPDRTEHWLRVRGHAIRNADGQPVRIAGISLDITDRKTTEKSLRGEIEERRRIEQRQDLLLGELNHRVRNMLAIVQSIARQTLRHASRTTDFRTAFESRIMALSQAHNLLTENNWDGAWVRAVVERMLDHYGGGSPRRFLIDAGTDVYIGPSTTVSLIMALHELATNAIKYGALSNANGYLRLGWSTGGDGGAMPYLRVRWEEVGGPKARQSSRRGFGWQLMRALTTNIENGANIQYTESGLVCLFDLPLTAPPH